MRKESGEDNDEKTDKRQTFRMKKQRCDPEPWAVQSLAKMTRRIWLTEGIRLWRAHGFGVPDYVYCNRVDM